MKLLLLISSTFKDSNSNSLSFQVRTVDVILDDTLSSTFISKQSYFKISIISYHSNFYYSTLYPQFSPTTSLRYSESMLQPQKPSSYFFFVISRKAFYYILNLLFSLPKSSSHHIDASNQVNLSHPLISAKMQFLDQVLSA